MNTSKLPEIPIALASARSFDARDWAGEYVECIARNPSIATDKETMTTWFSGSIMAGYDEAMRRRNKESLIANAGRIYGERAAMIMVALMAFGALGTLGAVISILFVVGKSTL